MRPESKVVKTNDNYTQSTPAQGTPQSGPTADDKIRQYYNEQYAKQLEQPWQEYSVNPPLSGGNPVTPLEGQTQPSPVVTNSDPVYYTPDGEITETKSKKISSEDKPKVIKDLIDNQDFSETVKKALYNDNNYTKYMSDVIDYTNKITDCENEIKNLQKKYNSVAGGNSQDAQLERMDIEKQIRYKKIEIRGLQSNIDKTLSLAFDYSKFIGNWEDGKTSKFNAFGWGKLDLASTITTVTLKNGQKAYMDNNGIYYGIDRAHLGMPDPKNVIDVSKIK